MSFLNDLDIRLTEDGTWRLIRPLHYRSEIAGDIVVPSGFLTDFASVPRLPFVYETWGNRAHREAVVHDYLYRINSFPVVSFMTANRVFLEAMESRGVSWLIRYPMFWAVCAGGWPAYHKMRVPAGGQRTIRIEGL